MTYSEFRMCGVRDQNNAQYETDNAYYLPNLIRAATAIPNESRTSRDTIHPVLIKLVKDFLINRAKISFFTVLNKYLSHTV